MPERQLAGKAHHQVPGLAHIGEVEDQDQHRQHDSGRQRAAPRAAAASRSHEQHARPRRCERARSCAPPHQALRPQHQHQDQQREREHALHRRRDERSPASASDTPISTPPTSAPAIEPSPPTMTMMKAMQRIDRAELGLGVGDRHHQGAGRADAGEPEPEGERIEPPHVEADHRGADEIVGAGADRGAGAREAEEQRTARPPPRAPPPPRRAAPCRRSAGR